MNTIILTGGSNRRFGSDKSEEIIGNKNLLQILVSNLPASELIIVGPRKEIPAIYVRETPLHSGPLAGIAAGVDIATEDLVAIYATDMPFAPKLLNQLLAVMTKDGAVPIDEEGIIQPLCGVYRRERLKAALATYLSFTHQSVKSLMSKLDLNLVDVSNKEFLLDIDTRQDLEIAIQLQESLENLNG